MERNHQNYFGRTAQVFVPLGTFGFTQSDLTVDFRGWSSVESFDRGDQPLPFLTNAFRMDGVDFLQFRETNRNLFDEMSSVILEIINLQPNDGWTLKTFIIRPTDRIFVAIAVKDGERERVETVPGAQFDSIIAEHSDLVQNVLSLAWQFGTEKSEWLSNLTPIQDAK